MEYLHIICIGLLAFFSFSLFTKKNKPLSEKIFSFWIVLLIITVFSFLIYAKGLARQYPVFITLTCDSHLLHGAFLYIYVLAFTNSNFKLQPIHLLHLIPAFFQIIIKLYLNFVLDKMECYEAGGCMEEGNIFVNLSYLYKYLVLGAYIYFSWKQVVKYRQGAKKPREAMRSEWVKQVVTGVFFLYMGILLLQIGRFIYPALFWDRMLLGNTLATLFIYVFLYIGNSYTYLFVMPSKSRFKNLSETINVENCQRDKNAEEFAKYFEIINNYMVNQKPYLQGPLTIKDLSDKINIPQTVISQTINEIAGKSISDYVNEFKVEHLKTLLQQPENKCFKIMTLAEQSGFNSKSTLVRIFKQFTGYTPSEYQNLVENKTAG